MLSYILAIVVGTGSLGLYLAAFLFPEVHRKYDLVWSGVGLFYGLVLWVCAGRITGAVLLGQMASVALLGWLSWQTLTLRRAQTPAALQTQLPEAASAQDIFQITIRQLRANLSQSTDRSSLIAQLDQAIARLETAWDSLQIWFTSLNNPAEHLSNQAAAELTSLQPDSDQASQPNSSNSRINSQRPFAPTADRSEPEPASSAELDPALSPKSEVKWE